MKPGTGDRPFRRPGPKKPEQGHGDRKAGTGSAQDRRLQLMLAMNSNAKYISGLPIYLNGSLPIF